MRTISAALATAQQSGTADPYINITINSTDYSSRLVSLEHIEEPYRSRATIILANSDRFLDGTDLRGQKFYIGYGYTSSGTNYYCGDGTSEATPNLWVISQTIVSMEGKSVCVLECEGSWMKLRGITLLMTAKGAPAPYLNILVNSTDTIMDLMSTILVECGFTLVIGTLDTVIQTFKPSFIINHFEFENAPQVLYRLVVMTRYFLREVEGECI